MMAIDTPFKAQARGALIENRKQFEGSDQQFARKWGMAGSVWSRIQKGQLDGVLSDGKWIDIARILDVGIHERQWQTARTAVFNRIEEEVKFCQANSDSMIYVDDCGSGKTWTAKYLSKSLRSCFYIDCSQAKTRQQFVKKLANALGIDIDGKHADIKKNIKFYLTRTTRPIIIVDEAGDLDYNALLELKEFWNATEGACGWYMMGADGLKAKFDKGIRNKVVGYREIFSRFNNRYSSTVPIGMQEKIGFYKNLIRTVVEANVADKTIINEIVNKCITKDGDGNIGGLRRAATLIALYQQEQ